MASNYPGGLDSFATTRTDATVSATTHALDHNNANDALNKIEVELGTSPRGSYSDVKTRLNDMLPKSAFDAKGDLIAATANDAYARLPISTDGFLLAGDASQAVGMKWTNNLNLTDVGTGPRITARGSQTDTIDVYSTRSNSAPGATTQGLAVVPNTLCTDTADPFSFAQTGIISYATYGDATHSAVGSTHAGTFWNNVVKSGNANNEHAGIANYLVYSATATPGRGWMYDGNLHGAISTQQSLLMGHSVFMNNYYNGQPSSTGSVGIIVSTKAGTGGGATAAHNAATTYPIQQGLWIMGSSSGGSGRGYENGIWVGGTGGGWGVAASKFGNAIAIQDYELGGLVCISRIGSTAPAIAILDGAGDIQFGTTTGVRIGTGTTQKIGFWNATPVVRPTGWAAATNTKARTTFDTTTVTLPNLAARVGALIDDLIAIGLIGA